MELTLAIADTSYRVNLDQVYDLAIPIRFDGTGLRAFGAPTATSAAYHADGFVGDIAQGGSCNCDMLQFAPHLHGTHTESIGHINASKLSAYGALKESLMPATLVTVMPQQGARERYNTTLQPDDRVITKASLDVALKQCDTRFLEALIVRTLPNDVEKKTCAYDTEIPPYFSAEAMEYIVALGVNHLLCDLPSIDRTRDAGHLTNHHLFWEIARGDAPRTSPKTITELIYVHDVVADGNYLLNLQVAPLMVDAAPSRPLLYGIIPL
jgi:arylformamidase